MPRVLKPACFRKFEAIPTLFPWTYRLKPKPQTLKPVCFPRVWSYSDPLTLSADSKTESSHLKTCLLQKVWCYSDPSTSVAVPLYGWLSSELFFPCCIGMLFSYNYRPYEISIIIGIVAPILHRDAVFIQLSTVRNFDYHRNCCSHAAWGCSFSTSVYRTKFRLSSELFLSCWMGMLFFYKCRPYEISIIIGIVAPMLHGDSFFYKCRPYEISIIIGIVAPIQFSNNHIHFFS